LTASAANKDQLDSVSQEGGCKPLKNMLFFYEANAHLTVLSTIFDTNSNL
jgi:hypothetical protein